MTATIEFPAPHLTSQQANDLSLLVDLEARWENMRVYLPATPGKRSTREELHQKQKAYEAFFAKLAAYNQRYRPVHVPELLLNNAARLRLWCRKMRDLHLQLEQSSYYPSHLLEKAYRCADRLADRLKKERITRPTLSGNLPTAIRELEDLAQWCDNLSPVTPVS